MNRFLNGVWTADQTYLYQKIVIVIVAKVVENDFLKRVGQLEEQLHKTRKQIVLEEIALLSLEKKLFLAQQNLDRQLRQSYRSLVLREEQTESQTKEVRKKVGGQIKALSKQTKTQQIMNAVWEQKVLQRELESLQRGFNKALKKAGKK
ncbi:MAG: hypothetical protein V1777_03415 [Candidatus Micrarchaeota archaeon]